MNGSSNIKGSAVYSFATDGWRAPAESFTNVKICASHFKSGYRKNNRLAAGAFTAKPVKYFRMMMITLVFQVAYNHELIN